MVLYNMRRPRTPPARSIRSLECQVCLQPLATIQDTWVCGLCTCVMHASCWSRWRQSATQTAGRAACPGCRQTQADCIAAFGGVRSMQIMGIVCYVCRADIVAGQAFQRCARPSHQCLAHWHEFCVDSYARGRSGGAGSCPACHFTASLALQERCALTLSADVVALQPPAQQPPAAGTASGTTDVQPLGAAGASSGAAGAA